MGKIFYIIGKSASGKDHIYEALLAEKDLKLAQVILYTTSGMREAPLERGSMAAKTAQLYLIDLLYQRFYERNREECQKNSERAIETVVRETY